ncbi:MAG: PadR family transcriptional regulator [Candidatus Heimdallarchaeaceae archaeon]
MMRNIKSFSDEALISSVEIRNYVENFESELLRGISTLAVLSIIKEEQSEGIYGYKLLKSLEERTKHTLIIEEGTLYPLLRKLERDGLLSSEKIRSDKGRLTKYYYLTDKGVTILEHMNGFFGKLIEAIAPLMDFQIELPRDKFLYCPNCANKINLEDYDVKFCNICGLNIEHLIKRGD